MYKVNDLVMYGINGVYKVEEICKPNISGVNNDKLYYVLNPLYSNGKTYTPVDTNVFMRPVITCKAAQQLIDQMPSIKADVYDNSNFKILEDSYKVLLQTHDCVDLIQLIKSIYTKKKRAFNNGKKLGQIDERYMKLAEDLLYGEFAVALDIPKENVTTYIEERIKDKSDNGISFSHSKDDDNLATAL